MNTIEALKLALNNAKNFADLFFNDIADEPMTRWHPERGQHAYWLLGHLVVGEGSLLDQYLLGRPNRYEAWWPLFGGGTVPQDAYQHGPTYDELLAELDGIRAAVLAHIDTLGEDDLDKPCHEGPGPAFETIGQCLFALSQHMSYHTGQVACVRRAAGRKPLFF